MDGLELNQSFQFLEGMHFVLLTMYVQVLSDIL